MALLKLRQRGLEVGASVAQVLRDTRTAFDKQAYGALLERNKRTQYWLTILHRQYGTKPSSSQPAASGLLALSHEVTREPDRDRKHVVSWHNLSPSERARRLVTASRSTTTNSVEQDLRIFMPGTTKTPRQRYLVDDSRRRAQLHPSAN